MPQRDGEARASAGATSFEYLLGVGAQWRDQLASVLSPLQQVRDAMAADFAVAEALGRADRVQVIEALSKFSGQAVNCRVVAYDTFGVPIAMLHFDAIGEVQPDPRSPLELGTRECREEFVNDALAADARAWIAVMPSCADEGPTSDAKNLLVGCSPVRSVATAPRGVLMILWELEAIESLLSTANQAGRGVYNLSLLNWNSEVIHDGRMQPTANWEQPPLETLGALSAVSFDAEHGLLMASGRQLLVLVPLDQLSERGSWVTSLMFCANPNSPAIQRTPSGVSGRLLSSGVVFGVLFGGVAALVVGIVARRRLVEANLAVRAAADEAVAERNRLISGVSHDIRGPLGAIVGFAELVRTDPAYGDAGALRDNAFEAIKRSCNFILRLTDHLLDLRSATMGRLSVESRFTDVLVICEECMDLYSIEARTKGLTFFFSHPGIERLQILGDPTRIRQIVQNLVGNAVRYTDHGSVALSLWIPEGSKEEIEISVSDTGIGISPEAQSKVFAPFYREKRAEGAPRSGTGLGLAVVNTIVGALGGSIQLTSEVGKGSVFAVRIPAKRWVDTDQSVAVQSMSVPDSSGAGTLTQRLLGVRVAFADDYAEAREITGHLLRGLGATVSTFVSGTDLLEAVHCGLEVDCVLLDLQMPGLSGHQTAEALRKCGYGGPMVALSALADAPSLARSEQVGFAAHLSKPVDPNALGEVLARVVAEYASQN